MKIQISTKSTFEMEPLDDLPMETTFPMDVTATKIEELQVITPIENVVSWKMLPMMRNNQEWLRLLIALPRPLLMTRRNY